MRPIDADTLIAEYDGAHVGPPGRARELIINAQTVQPEPQWIPCSERLPEEDHWLGGSGKQFSENVMVTIVNHSDEDTWVDMTHTVDGEWMLELPRHCEITAWMPLPEPYKGGGGVNRMSDEIKLIMGDDGMFHNYEDKYDLTIHCETQEELDEVRSMLKRMVWHECDPDDPSSFPDDDRPVLVSLSDSPIPAVGWFERNDDFYGWTDGEQFGLHADGWWELPEKPEAKMELTEPQNSTVASV